MFVGADVIAFSGSLNTMDDETFYATLRRAYDATAATLVFNFLASPFLAARPKSISLACPAVDTKTLVIFMSR